MMRDLPECAIEELQGKAPGSCKADHDDLLGKLETMCSPFTEQQRRILWENICNNSQSCLIPSLFTFFEDRKFLANAANCIRAIVDEGASGSVRSKLQQTFHGNDEQADQCVVQISATSYGRVSAHPAQRRLLAMHQIWLAAFRLSNEITPKTQRRNALAKPRSDTSEVALYNLAALASRLGFRSRRIEALCRTSPDQLVAERALIAARDPRFFYYPDKERCVQRVAEVFKVAAPKVLDLGSRSGDVVIREQPPKRYGLPYDTDHEKDKTRLFLPQLEKGLAIGDWNVSSIFVRWSVYLAYFGHPPPVAECLTDCEDLQTTTLPPPSRIGLSPSGIRQALQPEQDSQDVEESHSELLRLRALVAAEQDRVDEKDILLERAHAELQRLENRQGEEQQRLYHLLRRIREAEKKLQKMREAEEKLRHEATGALEASKAVSVNMSGSRHIDLEADAGDAEMTLGSSQLPRIG
jgi:hypothetical protein